MYPYREFNSRQFGTKMFLYFFLDNPTAPAEHKTRKSTLTMGYGMNGAWVIWLDITTLYHWREAFAAY